MNGNLIYRWHSISNDPLRGFFCFFSPSEYDTLIIRGWKIEIGIFNVNPCKLKIMKNTLALAALLVFSLSTMAQETQQLNYTVYDSLMHKSVRQKKTAGILLGVGAVVSVGTLAIIAVANSEAIFYGGSVFVIAGIGSMIASIPFYIASSSSRKKAQSMKLGLRVEHMPGPAFTRQIPAQYPALQLSIPIR
jgi:hypothetical protein